MNGLIIATWRRKLSPMLESFEPFTLNRDGVRPQARRAGVGPALLLLHGHPQSMVMCHRVALARSAPDHPKAVRPLIQPPPLPEVLIAGDPVRCLRSVTGNRHAGLTSFDLHAMVEYERCIPLPGTAESIREDHRAGPGIDLEHVRAVQVGGEVFPCGRFIAEGPPEAVISQALSLFSN